MRRAIEPPPPPPKKHTQVVEARTYDDVIEAVKDTVKYPTPVRALGTFCLFFVCWRRLLTFCL